MACHIVGKYCEPSVFRIACCIIGTEQLICYTVCHFLHLFVHLKGLFFLFFFWSLGFFWWETSLKKYELVYSCYSFTPLCSFFVCKMEERGHVRQREGKDGGFISVQL